ncbi:hypothetical protein AOT98_19985 [Shigella flexneri 1a]|nr:hypothetical protein AOT98_19985 [Shigella flexneri 1a]AMN57843.1 hypothetical protein AD867_08270 [Shigella flexneri 2a]AMN62867.1 hypothetical protein AD871_09895 [Shigella flexneri 4c]
MRRFTPGSAFRLQSEPQATIFQQVCAGNRWLYPICSTVPHDRNRALPAWGGRFQNTPSLFLFAQILITTQHVLPLVELIYEIPKPLNPYACDVVLDDWLQAFQDCGEYSPHV